MAVLFLLLKIWSKAAPIWWLDIYFTSLQAHDAVDQPSRQLVLQIILA